MGASNYDMMSGKGQWCDCWVIISLVSREKVGGRGYVKSELTYDYACGLYFAEKATEMTLAWEVFPENSTQQSTRINLAGWKVGGLCWCCSAMACFTSNQVASNSLPETRRKDQKQGNIVATSCDWSEISGSSWIKLNWKKRTIFKRNWAEFLISRTWNYEP